MQLLKGTGMIVVGIITIFLSLVGILYIGVEGREVYRDLVFLRQARIAFILQQQRPTPPVQQGQ